MHALILLASCRLHAAADSLRANPRHRKRPAYEDAAQQEAVQWASTLLGNASQHPAFYLSDTPRRKATELSFDGSPYRVKMQQVAHAFEVATGSVGNPQGMPAGIGVAWFGVETQQSVTDSATLHRIMWSVKPDLIIEIGTWCGGSAIFYAKTALGYNSSAKVVTVDMVSPDSCKVEGCPKRCRPDRARKGAVQGLQSPFWKELRASGNLVVLEGDASHPRVLNQLRKFAAAARTVMIIDDGSHLASDLVPHFRALQGLVTPSSYYLVQDTRLDFDCAHAILHAHRAGRTYPRGKECNLYIRHGGPARAVQQILELPEFVGLWEQDRSVEEWIITQHPGGYLQRRPVRLSRMSRKAWCEARPVDCT